MLHLHFSNRFESLRNRLLARLAGPREDVFRAEAVLVPSAAMQRRLSLDIADAQGVCANVEFVFLARWLWAQVARVVPGVQEESPFDTGSLAWRVYGVLRDAAFVQAHPRLARYLAHADEAMRYELAVRVASLLEQYVTYRTDWLAAWQDGRLAGLEAEDEAWQAALWQRIAADLALGRTHPVAAMADALRQGGAALARERRLPDTVQVFAPAAMPPLHLQALHGLAQAIDVHLYVLSPCEHYWHDLVDERRLSRLQAQGRADGHEVGHRLLAAWGQQTQAHLALLADTSHGAHEDDDYGPDGRETLLARLQDGILTLQDFAPGALAVDDGDDSLRVNVCHSLTRELEVLHEQLLALFARDPTLAPHEVLVVTPDLEAAAPAIEAVFGTATGARRISFAITGRARSRVNAPVRAFLELLALASSRCTASAVLGLLQQGVVARRFGLAADDLQQVRGWIADAGIHWGLDAVHVAALDLPDHAAHTFDDGLDRLFLGYALPAQAKAPFADALLPRGDAEGSAAAALGAFSEFVDALESLRQQMARPRHAGDWASYLHEIADRFIEPGDDEVEDHIELHATIAALAATMARAGLAEAVPPAVIRTALNGAFDDAALGGVPTGRVTFTGMNSLRNLPFRRVVVVGLNDGAFPTPDRPPEFDLMAQAPRPGDRQRRTDQRTLFLDLLLAARDGVILSYTGRSVRDNASMPPSVLVSELLEVVLPAIADPHARRKIVTAHPLQPFRLAVRPPPAVEVELRDEEETDEGEEAVAEPVQPFFTLPLPPAGPEWRDVGIDALVRFFENPSRYLLNRRLGLELPRTEDALEDDEPFLPSVRARSRLAAQLLPLLLQGMDGASVRRIALASTELPVGSLGDADRERELASLERFAAEVRGAVSLAPLQPQTAVVELALGDENWRVHASYADLRPGGLVRWRYDEERPRDLLNAWLHHLALCAAAPEGVERRTRWLSLSPPREFGPRSPRRARALLAELLSLYRTGLSEPLPFFAKSAWAYVENGQSIHAARQKWNGYAFGGEKDDPAHRLVFRGVADPLDERFAALADAVFDPMLREGEE